MSRKSLQATYSRILELLKKGADNKEIAKNLKLSVPTIKIYLCRLFKEYKVDSRVQLVVKLFEKEILELKKKK